VAHVVQRDTQSDILTLTYPGQHTIDAVEVRLFHEVAVAEEWLRSCQRPPGSLNAHCPLT
jgi:hypothetical protein